MRLWTVLPLIALSGCAISAATDNALCDQDSDCAGALRCVADLTASRSYCASLCSLDSDCEPHQRCQSGVNVGLSGAVGISLCVDQVRECAEAEMCNGLDDDCDGIIDNAGCTPVIGCLDDLACGAWVCSALANQPAALCVEPNREPPVADYQACSADDQCRNGLCDTGLCVPLCRPEIGLVRPLCLADFTCARAVGPRDVAAHNECQSNCLSDRDCTVAGQACVWRDVYQDEVQHQFVCSPPAPERLPLGAACSSFGTGDDECAHGLCFGLRCTRPCGGAGTDCSDVGPDLVCKTEQLRYGTSEFMVDICTDR